MKLQLVKTISFDFTKFLFAKLLGETFFCCFRITHKKSFSRILQLTVVRFLQFAGSKATEYELMECCIVAHIDAGLSEALSAHPWNLL